MDKMRNRNLFFLNHMHLYLKILKNNAKKYENNLKSCTEAAVP